jgi:hypothetical protein
MSLSNLDFSRVNLKAAYEISSDIEALAERALLDINGGTIDDGIAVAECVQRKASTGVPVEPILIDAEYVMAKDYGLSSDLGEIVVAKCIPENIGLVFGFGLAESEEEAAEVLKKVHSKARILHLGKSGLMATTEIVANEDDFTDADKERYTRTAGFMVLPELPVLRASLI